MNLFKIVNGAKHTGWSEDSNGYVCLQTANSLIELGQDEVFPIDLTDAQFDLKGKWHCYRSDRYVVGFFEHYVKSESIQEITCQAYREMLKLIGDKKLYRIWNFVPNINQIKDGLENYRSFSSGRFEAFHGHYGEHGILDCIPAASAVGSVGDQFLVYFIAGVDEVEHFENPNQIPAYRYPDEYGPRPPYFSRASKVLGADRALYFISGTASVIGHKTVAAGDLESQLSTTFENLKTIATSVGAWKEWDGAITRIYIRNQSDYDAIREQVEGSFLKNTQRVYIEADICRSDLLVEIEISGSIKSPNR